MNSCQHCGATLGGGVRFCPQCGKALDAAGLPTMTSPYRRAPFFTATRGRKASAWLDG